MNNTSFTTSIRNDMKNPIYNDIKRKIHYDIKTQIHHYYDDNDIVYKDCEDPEDVILDFFTYLMKFIPVKKWNVLLSNKLIDEMTSGDMPAEVKHVLNKYKRLFEEGENMNVFLSDKTSGVRKPDYLMYTWKLYHLHMCDVEGRGTLSKKNTRSDKLLLCIVNDYTNEICFVDYIDHPTRPGDFFDLRLLKIIIENGWIEKIGFAEVPGMVPGSLNPKITDGDDIFELYSKGKMNAMFELDGKGYGSMEPLSSSRHPYRAVKQLTRINRNISQLSAKVKEYMGLEIVVGADNCLHSIVSYVNNDDKVMKCDIF